MSDSLISWKPRIDEPSKPMPSLKSSSVKSSTGIEKCCHRPGRSMNLKSTNLTPRSFACASTALGEVFGCAIFGPVAMAIGSLLSSRFTTHFVRRRAGTTDDASLRSFRDSRRAIFLVGTRGLPRVQCPSSWANLCAVCTKRYPLLPTMPKYEPLREFLSGLPKGQKQVTLGANS